MKRNSPTRPLPPWYPHFRLASRAAMLLLGAVLAALVLTHVAFAIVNPFIKSHQVAVALAADEQLVRLKQQEKQQLAARVAWLQSPQGALEESRRKGMVKAGEQEVRFTFMPPLPSHAASLVTKETSRWNQLWWPVLCLLAFSFLVGNAWLLRQRRLARLRRPVGTLTPRSELQRRPRRNNAPFPQR